MRLLHVITGLGTGGAENMLYKLLVAMQAETTSAVVSLTDHGTFGRKIEKLGIPVHALGLSPGRPSVAALVKLVHLWRSFRPDLVQGWMYHANLAVSVAGMLTPRRTPVLWNVRQTIYRPHREQSGSMVTIRAGAAISGFAEAIIYNSETAARQHEDIGYSRKKTKIIPNGFDCSRFRPNAKTRARVRDRLRIPEEAVVVGVVARYHPAKGHGDFLRAAGLLARRVENVRFILIGKGVDAASQELVQLLAENELGGKALLLGERDSRRILPACDILALSSFTTDSFPNAVGEAMACALPVVMTEVGDARRIVGEGGIVVPAGNPTAMANALGELVDTGAERRERIGRLGQERVRELFSIERIAGLYRQLYAGSLTRGGSGAEECAE